MLTFTQIKALTLGQSVNYTPPGSGNNPSSCTVVRNGPPMDTNGNPMPNFPAQLMIQVGAGPMTVNWGYDGLYNGLIELSLPT
jgi:hypothetical protein